MERTPKEDVWKMGTSSATLLRELFDELYSSHDMDAGVNTVLKRIGETYGVSRVYVFENNDDNSFTNNTYEWCAPGIQPEIDNLQHMSYGEFDYRKMFDKNGLFFAPAVSELSSPVRKLMEKQGIRATIQYALYDDKRIRGFVGFDDCVRERRDWLDDARILETLMYGSKFLSVYLLKERTLRHVRQLQEELTERLEIEHRLRQEALSASQAKTEFLSMVSHDMRTPLNGILGLTHLMKEHTEDEVLKNDLRQLENSGRYLLNLISDTLDVSKIESGRLELHPTVCDGQGSLNNMLSLLEPNLEEKGIRFKLHIAPIKYMQLYIDIGRVEQVIMNIIGNAIKFTPRGGQIDFYLKNVGIKDGVIIDQITVRDSGIGMRPEFIPHIFEAFTQENQGSKTNYNGTGLGMTISKQIIEMMGGTIQVESELGVGTSVIFTLHMPIATPSQIADAQRTSGAERETDMLCGKRVLLCEDHPLNTTIAIRLLESQGILVEHAENGKIGVERFTQSPENYFDGILMDIRMPVMDGFEAARRIRASSHPQAATIPILAMTANALDTDIQQSLDAGMNVHLSKPIDPKQLFDSLAQQMRGCETVNQMLSLSRSSAQPIVLVVDDVRINAMTMQATLEPDYEVRLAQNGQEALEMLEKEPDILAVVTDIQMPVMNGVELIRRIRAHKRYRRLAILANTQYGDPNQVDELLAIGADDFIYKPSSPTVVTNRVKSILRKYGH